MCSSVVMLGAMIANPCRCVTSRAGQLNLGRTSHNTFVSGFGADVPSLQPAAPDREH